MSINGPLMTAEKVNGAVLIASRSLDNGWQDVVLTVDQAIDLISELQAVTKVDRVLWHDEGGDKVALLNGYTLYAYPGEWDVVDLDRCVKHGEAASLEDAKRQAIAYAREQTA